MTLRRVVHSLAYRAGSSLLPALVRIPVVAPGLTLLSKIWLRHARLYRHLRMSDYDQIVDCGANIGEFAELARRARPGVPLLCVEPHPDAAQTLRRRGFEVIEAAAWNREGSAELTQPTEASTSATLVGSGGTEHGRWTVRTVRLDGLALTGKRILLKLDLQGAEEEALEGLSAAWPRIVGVLLEVTYGENGNSRELARRLEQQGFYEAATFNELDARGRALEADKLWLRPGDD